MINKNKLCIAILSTIATFGFIGVVIIVGDIIAK